MSAPTDSNPPFSQHVKMLCLCLGMAVSLAAGILVTAYGAYQVVIWIGSH